MSVNLVIREIGISPRGNSKFKIHNSKLFFEFEIFKYTGSLSLFSYFPMVNYAFFDVFKPEYPT
ncbi:hypothetical protein SAMD00079811_20940 [Scytonema sp. HK-05]|nr:hypothetical protein NIES2130_30865 [Scytonema sp. HK-05]BAY44494.1 hypothetical protein SAMD00079811_20940 [Scytonema sp. HK-05]